MLCLRCRALPSFQATVSAMRTPMTRITQFTPQTSLTSTARLSSRPFSTTLLSTPTRLQPSQTLSLSPRTPSTSALSTPSISSLLPPQSRAFSATASLGVKRNTFRPSRRVQKRRSGFLARNTDRKGRLTLIRRRLKGRKAMSW
ncbi:60S ribosomal protein L34 [Penicillium brasilianum]|uniref:60S ribosomal protein L34 n=1 Tax=Penicillium brasilianum TaxID=104259 RepID=A0A1S9RCZ3_PENBI|nr:60S ribosomal protein L34 [Penicillium brasilianum]